MNSAIGDIGEALQVWDVRASDALPDRAFVPTSESGIEMITDYEPVVYQSNRTLMMANAAQEINELQERNHATTAYSTLDCTAMPLFPTFNAQRAANCELRESGGGPGVRYLRPPVEPRRAAPGFPISNLYSDAREHPAFVDDPPPPPQPDFKRRMLNSVRGSLYDMKHWDELPPTREGRDVGDILKYTLSRDKRAPYLLLWSSLILLLIIMTAFVIKLCMKKA